MTKITRDAFLYLEPPEGYYKPEAFAQCETCRKFIPGEPKDLCIELGPNQKVGEEYSCGLYSPWPMGKPNPQVVQDHLLEIQFAAQENARDFVTAKAAGLVERQVRCENCEYFDKGKSGCLLYSLLNDRFPHIFNLNPLVKPLACCNAQTPKPKPFQS